MGECKVLADSGTLLSFTLFKSNLSDFKWITDSELTVQAAAASNTLRIAGKGVLFCEHTVNHKGRSCTITS